VAGRGDALAWSAVTRVAGHTHRFACVTQPWRGARNERRGYRRQHRQRGAAS
jgi:hypothetical protein